MSAPAAEITSAVEANGLQKSRMIILNALLRLRQICCDLRLLKLENIDLANASGKTDLFRELLEEVVDGGHRVRALMAPFRISRQAFISGEGFCGLASYSMLMWPLNLTSRRALRTDRTSRTPLP